MSNNLIISIREWAAANYLTPDEFTREILMYAAIVGSMAVDNSDDDSDAMKFRCSDNVSDIEVYVRRVYNNSSDDSNDNESE